jgi:hypothetical protein
MAFGGCVFFHPRPGQGQKGNQGQVEGLGEIALCFLFSLSSIEINAYLGTSGTSQTNIFLYSCHM